MADRLIKIGHRGAAGYEPENTLVSFQKAIELGADMIELDVHVCKSGELVVIHDDTLERTTNGKGKVSDMALAELKELYAGKGQRIPTLDEVLDLVDRRVRINIELKGKKTALPVAQTVMLRTEEGWEQNHFLVSSSDYDELRRFRIFDPFSRIGLIIGKLPGALHRLNLFDPFRLALELKCYSMHPRVNFAGRRFIETAHRSGLKVFPWTINSPAEARRLGKLGVDGIFSDYPDRLIFSEA